MPMAIKLSLQYFLFQLSYNASSSYGECWYEASDWQYGFLGQVPYIRNLPMSKGSCEASFGNLIFVSYQCNESMQ